MSQYNNSNAGTPRSGRFQVRIDGKSYYVASSEEIGQTGKARMWLEKRESSQQVKAQPFTIMLDDLSQGAGFSYAYDKLPQAYAWSAGFDAWAPGIISTRASLTTGASFTTSDVRGWQFQLGNYLYCCRGREVTKYAIAQGTSSWSIVERHDVDGTTPTGKVVTGRPEVFKGKAYIPIRTGVSGSLTVFQELTTQVTSTVEQQTIAISGTPTSGTYTVTFDGKTTAAIAYNASSATLQAALRLIPGLEDVTVSSTGSTPNFTHTVVMTGVGGALGTSSPPQMTSTDGTSGGAHAIAHATTVAGLTDTWTAAAANCTAASFRVYGNSLAKAQGSTATTDVNRVYFCTADPMVFANWAPSAATGYEFGEYGSAITDMVEYTPYLGVGKTNGLFTLDDSFQSHNAIKDFERFADSANCIGMEVAQGEVAIPFKSGLIVWDGSSYDVVGLGQEGFFNAAVDRGEGRFYSIAPAGDISYYVANDSYGGYAILGSFRNPETRRFSYGGASRAKVWQTYEIESGARYESVILLSAPNEPSAAHTPSIISDDSAVGTITWGTTSNVTALDGAYATAAAGTSHYLKALSPQPNVPTGATVTGVTVEVAKKAGGSLTVSDDTADGSIFSSSGTYATARAMTSPTLETPGATLLRVGQYNAGAYFCYQAFISFDTSAIPDTATILSAVPSISPLVANQGTWTMQARLHDWGATLALGDEVAGASLSAKTLLGTFAIEDGSTGSPVFTESAGALVANINKTGATRIILCHADQSNNVAPTATNLATLTSGESTAPTLTVTYTNGTVDNMVKLVVGGSVVGTNLADTSTVWPVAIGSSYTQYGGAANMWGTSISVAQANATDFGVVISSTTGTGDTASIDHIRMTVYYTVAGQSDTAALMSVLHVDSTRTIAYPVIYQLPRNGQRATYDPQLPKARDNAIFQTSRYHLPGRNVAKTYDSVEFYAEMSASNGTGPAFNVQYSFNDTDWDYLLNTNGGRLEVGAELGTAGKGKVVGNFPRTSTSWGTNLNLGTVALRFVLQTKTGGQINSSVVVRDIVVQGWYRTTRAGSFSLTLLLGELEGTDQQVSLRVAQQQEVDLRAAVGATLNYPLPYQSPDGRVGYAVFEELEFHEHMFSDRARDKSWPQQIATITGTWLEG